MDMIMPQQISIASVQASSHTVLIVEDDHWVRMPIAEFLRDCGYNVLEASDAHEAIETVKTADSVSLVFSDVRMPGTIDGFGLAEWLKVNRPEVPVLLTSGGNSYHNKRPLASRGVRLIEKPYSQANIARRIEELLRH
jgi:CheY-like chemotaxis protein